MAIVRKPARPGNFPGGTVDVDALINKGGSAPTREPAAREEETARTTTPIVLRLPAGLLQQVDTLLKARPVRIPRHTWLVEAVYEKIQRETEGSR